MLESRWGRRAGPAIATLGMLLAVAATASGAPGIADQPPPECAGPPGSEAAAWYALEPVVERGTLVGQRLTLGAVDGPAWTLGLPAASWATGPVAGQVLFGSDDGRRSTIRRFDAADGCVRTVGSTTEIVRSAILDPSDGAVHEHRLDRADRRDLGIWLRRPGREAAERRLPGTDADGRFGPTWRTELAWSDDGRHLVVAACGEVACRFRVVDRAGAVRSVDDPGLGALVGMLDGRLVVRGACRGLPCPVLSVDPDGGAPRVLDGAAGPVAPIAGDPGAIVVGTASGRPGPLHRVDVRTGRTSELPGTGIPLVAGHAIGATLPHGWFLVTDTHDLPRAGDLRARSIDRPARPLDEVRP